LSPTTCTGIAVFAEDVRVGKLLVRPLATRGSARFEPTEAQQRYQIDDDDDDDDGILKSLEENTIA
jgi:hypothetical protein